MENMRPSDNDYLKNSSKKIIDTVNYNGRYVDVSTIRNKIISGSLAVLALISIGILIIF